MFIPNFIVVLQKFHFKSNTYVFSVGTFHKDGEEGMNTILSQFGALGVYFFRSNFLVKCTNLRILLRSFENFRSISRLQVQF